MIEEIQEVEQGFETTDTGEQTKSEIEALASEMGWRPDGESVDGVALDAKAFILKGRDMQKTMREHINIQKKQLGELGSSVAELKTHNELVYKAELKRKDAEINQLKKERKEAIEDGDVEKVEELDGQIDGLKEEMVKPKPVTNSAYDDWVEKNKWYTEDAEMKEAADKIADENEGAPFKTIARLVELEVKRKFPDKFQTKTIPASPVEGAGKRIASTKFTKADLTDSQKSIMQQFVRQGIMSEAQYIKDIAATQGAA